MKETKIYNFAIGLRFRILLVLFLAPCIMFISFYWSNSHAQDVIDDSSNNRREVRSDLDKVILKLKSTALEKGSVRVIIDFQDSDSRLYGELDSIEQENLKNRIKVIQNDFLVRYADYDIKNIKQFQYIPSIAAEIGIEVLEKINQDYQIINIQEDEAVAPTLAESVPLVGAPNAWSAGFSGSGWTVAILDSGVDKNHSFLSGKVISEACYSSNYTSSNVFSVCPGGVTQSTASNSGLNCDLSIDGCNHGTHVAGIAAGTSASFSGVAKDANIISVQVFSRFNNQSDCEDATAPCARTYTSDQIFGLERVLTLSSSTNIAAVNMSLGGGTYTSNCDFDKRKQIIDNLRSVGIATVISSGNKSLTNGMGAPACISSAISVGSTGDGSNGATTDVVVASSNSASFLNLLAPGRWIRSSVPGGGFSNFNGTSMAAPHVAGTWAILKQRAPSASVTQVLNALTSTGQPITDSRNGIVKPRIKVDAALLAIGGTCNYTLNPSSRNFGSSSTTSSVSISTLAGCNWSASVNAPAFQELIAPLQNLSFIQRLDSTLSKNLTGTEQIAPQTVFLNSNPITINDRTGTNPPGTGLLYPSTINVAGMSGAITRVEVALNGITHSFPDDIDVILTGPGGQRSILMSDAGGNNDLTNVNLTFNQNAATTLPDINQISSGTFRPSNFASTNTTLEPNGIDSFPSPGPGQGNYTADLNVFNGTAPNGIWRLYVVDDEAADTGSISTGWALGITTSGGGTNWINITSGSSGTGNGTVNYSVAANTGSSTRTGTITVNGQVHTVTQAGAGSGCTYTLSTLSHQSGPSAGSTNIFMDAPSGCSWNAVSDSPSWLTTSSSGSGDGTISYSRTANTSTSPRTGRITVGGQTHTVTQLGAGSSGSIQFASSNYTVSENGTDAVITVTRSGGTGTGTIQYATTNGTATAGIDYTSVSGTLVFFNDEMSKTFSIPILDDTAYEGNESINLTLSSPSLSVTLGMPNTATLTISDNENPSIIRRPTIDFDGDGKTDISIFRPSNGQWWYQRSLDNQVSAVQFGTSSDKLAPADYTGDGKTDIAFWRESSGQWFILRSEDFSFYAFPFGISGDIPVPADFDGDGKFDPAVFRQSSGVWYVLRSSGGTTILQFGAVGDRPIVSDYDGDGKADLAITRVNNANREWWVRKSSDGQVFSTTFGESADKAVPGDYTGDGKADLAFWRSSNGYWYILRSEDFSFYGFPFGASGDIPAPGDYDGDGKFDPTVFRPSNAGWYSSRTNTGVVISSFGSNGDIPLSSAFIQ